MRVEIRCCCDPGKLLGTVEVDVPHLSEGQVFEFFLQPVIHLRPFWEQKDGDLFVSEPGERLSLPVGFWQGEIRFVGAAWERAAVLALSSNDTPIEKLRRIASFREETC